MVPVSLTPDNLTKEVCAKRGYHVVKVESWGIYPKLHRSDFLGIYDYLAFNDAGEMLAIQTTTKANVSARRKKMLHAKSFSWWTKGGRRSILHGWYKKSGRWLLHEEELTMDDWQKFQDAETKKNSVIDKNSSFFKELFPNGLNEDQEAKLRC